ncbi:coenzyme F420-0:L-glutamate ligase [Cupriavidus sp. 8B]
MKEAPNFGKRVSRELSLWAPGDIPLVVPGMDLVMAVVASAKQEMHQFIDGDIIVFAQKIVSKAENRLVNLDDVRPSRRAQDLATISHKDARLVEVILSESSEVVRCVPGLIIVRHKLGFVVANAGVDHSNVSGPRDGDWVLLLPEKPDQSAERYCLRLREETGAMLGVAIIDSWGRAWRIGTCGACIGAYGVRTVADLRGKPDLFGRTLETTIVGVGDELAAAASLLMGQSSEGAPIVVVRGSGLLVQASNASALVRSRNEDLFQ